MTTAAAAQREDPGRTLARILVTIAGADVCGFPLSLEQRQVLAAAGARVQREAGVTDAELDALIAKIDDAATPEICERSRDAYPEATARFIESLRRQCDAWPVSRFACTR